MTRTVSTRLSMAAAIMASIAVFAGCATSKQAPRGDARATTSADKTCSNAGCSCANQQGHATPTDVNVASGPPIHCTGYKIPPEDVARAEMNRFVVVLMRTTAGDITLELDRLLAPISVANFLRYAEAGEYRGTVFHRVVPGFVVQGGGYTKDLVELKGSPPIFNEWNNTLKNVRGTIAWARDADPNSATREFYINLVSNDKLDRPRPETGNAGYAVFGHVIAGMDVVDAIAAAASAEGGSREIPERDMKNVPTNVVEVVAVDIRTNDRP